MPGLRMYKKSFYSNIGANQPLVRQTINLGCTRGRGSMTRIAIFEKNNPPGETDYTWSLPQNIQTGNWFQIVTNSNGSYVAAIDANIYTPSIFVSNDSGLTFTNETTESHDYSGISMTPSGQIICAPAIRDSIFFSNNYGTTFNPTQDPGGFWYKSAVNNDGNITCIVKTFNNSGGPNGVFISTSALSTTSSSFIISLSGLYWIWSDVCMSNSGKIIAVCSYDGHVYITTNTGSSWNKISLPKYTWSGISMNKSGTNIVLCSLNGYIYVSNNTGNTWTSCAPSSLTWSSIYISSDASTIFACAINDNIYYSINNGTTWTMTSPNGVKSNWSSICCNNNGSYVYACVNGGNIYTGRN